MPQNASEHEENTRDKEKVKTKDSPREIQTYYSNAADAVKEDADVM